jgi:glyoxylase-like metal-dependent hydrolase (beta-lactamase superfamily II)
MTAPVVTGFYHEPTFSIAYLVEDPATKHAAIVDPVLDYDPKAGRISHEAADEMLAAIKSRGLTVDWILDTHPHADHFSAAAYLKEKLGAPTAIGEKITEVQELWKAIYHLPDFPADGSQWDRLFAHGDTFRIGSLEARVMFSPGHTKASITYVVGNAAFIHDTLFQPDYGAARTDFPGGDPVAFYHSIMAILALPADTRLFTGHDYRPGGRPAAWESSISEQWEKNPYLKGRPSCEEFVRRRKARDKTLPMPALILHALQVNMRGGRLPEPESDGRVYLKIPIGAL